MIDDQVLAFAPELHGSRWLVDGRRVDAAGRVALDIIEFDVVSIVALEDKAVEIARQASLKGMRPTGAQDTGGSRQIGRAVDSSKNQRRNTCS
jgi:hypothetical protein